MLNFSPGSFALLQHMPLLKANTCLLKTKTIPTTWTTLSKVIMFPRGLQPFLLLWNSFVLYIPFPGPKKIPNKVPHKPTIFFFSSSSFAPLSAQELSTWFMHSLCWGAQPAPQLYPCTLNKISLLSSADSEINYPPAQPSRMLGRPLRCVLSHLPSIDLFIICAKDFEKNSHSWAIMFVSMLIWCCKNQLSLCQKKKKDKNKKKKAISQWEKGE